MLRLSVLAAVVFSTSYLLGTYFREDVVANKEIQGRKKSVVNSSAITNTSRASLRHTTDLTDAPRELEQKNKAPLQVDSLPNQPFTFDGTHTSAKKLFALFRSGDQQSRAKLLDRIQAKGDECEWCSDFYNEIENNLLDPNLSFNDRRGYASALLQSGMGSGAAAVVSAAVGAEPQAVAALASALQATDPTEDIVSGISEVLNTEDDSLSPRLTSAMVSTLTRDGSLTAIETLYQHTVSMEDPDGYYMNGMGIGALTPEADALPYLRDLANKRDQYSHLAIKAILNFGDEGLAQVFTIFNEGEFTAADSDVLKSAVDRVQYRGGDFERYLNEQEQNATSPLARIFIDQIRYERELDRPGKDREYNFDPSVVEGLRR